MSEQSVVAIIVAAIGATGLIVAAIIGAIATIRAAKMKGPKHKMKQTHEPLNIPDIPNENLNPFDLNLNEQEYGTEQYIEAIGARLLESRDSKEIHIRIIK